MRGFVYFAEKRGRIKIGFSENPLSRLGQLGSGTRLLGFIPGTRIKERNLHAKFGEIALGKEWFKDDQRIYKYIQCVGAKRKMQTTKFRRRPVQIVVATKISLELFKRLVLRAKEEDRSISSVIRRVIERYLDAGKEDAHRRL